MFLYAALNRQENKVQFFIPKDSQEGYINNKQEKRVFQFNQLFDMETSQQKIFDKVAKDVIDSALSGYNGTIFAYGQTGSGKTFTMTGGSGSYDDRGLIPRTLSYIFNQSKVRSEKINVTISYLQIYQSHGYDLLAAQNKSGKLEGLPKIQPRQGLNDQLYLTNLSAFKCQTQQDALNCLFLGDLNRVVSKTPKNDESTRSHCIFTINLQISKPDSDIKTESKIQLVDLSGSERIKTTGVEGKLEKEAININLGLHYLERVITQLNRKMRGENVHVPYRESLMTMILKTSLGGNCKTKMIATMSPKEQDVMQSISTLKFAQRVALIKNDLTRNEVVDPGVIIARLKQQNAQLKAQIALLKGQQAKDELDKYEIEDCHKAVDKYLESQDPASALILSDRLKINECFYYLKTMLKKGGRMPLQQKQNQMNENRLMKSVVEGDDMRTNQQIRKLKLLVQQRDNQIALLLSLIRKKTGQNNEVVIPVRRTNQEQNLLRSVVNEKPLKFPAEEMPRQTMKNNYVNQTKNSQKSSIMRTELQQSRQQPSQMDPQQLQRILTKPVNISTQQLLNETQAYEAFRKNYRKSQAMQKNLIILKQKMAKGKDIGKTVNDLRQQISGVKQRLQNLKRQNIVNSLAQGRQKIDPEQQRLQNHILQLKQKYKTGTDNLRIIKNEIDSIKALQQKLKQQLVKDFRKWYEIKQSQMRNMTNSINSSLLTSNIRDQEVMNHLQSFMAARQQIRRRN